MATQPLRETLVDFFWSFAESSARFLTFDDGFRSVSFTYRQVAQGAFGLAREIEVRGIVKGDKVVICGESRPGWVMALWGMLLRGVVVVPLEASSSDAVVAKIVAMTQAKWVLRNAELEWVEGLQGERLDAVTLTGEDLAEILFTSGSTAEPKGVLITHRNVLANLLPVEREILKYRGYGRPFRPLRFLNLLPLSHLFGQAMTTFIPPVLEAEVVFLRGQNPREVARQVKRRRLSMLVAVPKMLELLRDSMRVDLPETREAAVPWNWLPGKFGFLAKWWQYRRLHRKLGWKFWAFVVGAAPLPEDVEAFWNQMGYLVVQGYGLTETAPIVSLNHPFHARKGSVGKAIAGVEIRLAEDGEILVRGDNVSQGYFGEVEGQARIDGWLHTGDMGEMDAQGNLSIRGRKKEMIVLADGRNVFPEDVERVLVRQAGVRECAVVGMTEQGREVPVAVLVLEAGADGEAVLRGANSELEAHQRVASFRLWTDGDLPKTAGTKKLKRRQIAEWVAGVAVVRPAGSDGWTELLAQYAPGRKIGAETRIEDLGLSSLDRIQFLLAAEEKLGVSLDEGALARVETVGELRRAAGSEAVAEIAFPRWASGRLGRWVRRVNLPLWILPLARVFAWLRVEGREHVENLAGPVVLVANHQSYFDTPVVYAALPGKVRYWVATAMAKEFFAAHFHGEEFGWGKRLRNSLGYYLAAWMFHGFPLPRTESGTKQALQYAGELASQGYSILIYPEGEHARDGQVGRFHSGAVLLAQKLGLPVVPVRIRGVENVLHPTSRMARPGRVSVRFGEAIEVRGMELAKATQKVEDAVRSL
jgi:long-chain acyl-CoA synthetase